MKATGKRRGWPVARRVTILLVAGLLVAGLLGWLGLARWGPELLGFKVADPWELASRWRLADAAPNAGRAADWPQRTPAQRSGTVWLPLAEDPYQPPRIEEVPLPHLEQHAVWGSVGRSDDGRIWLGVSAPASDRTPSAKLFEFAVADRRLLLAGDVVGALRVAAILRPGEGQMKIHSKVMAADDGYLYFTSMDERGESDDGRQLPTWGGHLWRLDPDGRQWEHLLATPEALIAAAAANRWVYALGYFGHTLYQFDIKTGERRHLRVGSPGAHISRNLLVTPAGHALVPRVRQLAAETSPPGEATSSSRLDFDVELVEFDEQLKELRATPLEHYRASLDFDQHGIVSFASLSDGTLIFATASGYLYRVTTPELGPAHVEPLGWLHPDGESYASTLFPLDGTRYLGGLPKRGGAAHEWVVYDLETRRARAVPIPDSDGGGLLRRANLTLYGCQTRDDRGGCYVVGLYRKEGRGLPVALRVVPPQPNALRP